MGCLAPWTKLTALLLPALAVGALLLYPLPWRTSPPASRLPVEELLQPRPVNVNTADAQRLQTLEGIGEKRAEAIVDDRKVNGLYSELSDLSRIKGISLRMTEAWAGEAVTQEEPHEAG